MLILSTCIKQKARVLIPHEHCFISLFASLYFQVSTCTHQPTTLFSFSMYTLKDVYITLHVGERIFVYRTVNMSFMYDYGNPYI